MKKLHPVVRMVSGPGTGHIWWVCPTCKREPGWRKSRHAPRCNGVRLYWPSWEPVPDEWLLAKEEEIRVLRRKRELSAQLN